MGGTTNRADKAWKAAKREASAHNVLGVDAAASEAAIRAAYRRRLLETHPDKAGGNRAAFDAVQSAYVSLSQRLNVKTHEEEDHAPTVIVDTVSLSCDMDVDEDEGVATYECRCGDAFELPLDDVMLASRGSVVVVTCHGCSLSIAVQLDE